MHSTSLAWAPAFARPLVNWGMAAMRSRSRPRSQKHEGPRASKKRLSKGLGTRAVLRRGLAAASGGFVVYLLFRAYRISQEPRWAPVYRAYALNSFPHDTAAFTQGLVFYNGELLESTGLFGQSDVRRCALNTGKPIERTVLESSEFGEGLALLPSKSDDANPAVPRLVQLMWKIGRGRIYDAKSLTPLGDFSFPGDGWGAATDTEGNVYVSDGSAVIRVWKFMENGKVHEVRRFMVMDGNRPVGLLNELEIIRSELWANIWNGSVIARIDLRTGRVLSWVLCGDLLKKEHLVPGKQVDVLNGIAHDAENDRIFVTGKLWPRVYEIKVQPTRAGRDIRKFESFFLDPVTVNEIMSSTV